MLKIDIEDFEQLKTIQIPRIYLPGDVLERLKGRETFVDTEEIGDEIIPIDSINDIITDSEDDTNETTKIRLEELYKQIKDFDYLMLTNG